jgi:hypothetical protein
LKGLPAHPDFIIITVSYYTAQWVLFREAWIRNVGGQLRSHRIWRHSYRPENDTKMDLGEVDGYVNCMELKSYVVCDITPCSPLNIIRRFGGTFRLHIQGRISQAINQREVSRKRNVVSQKIELITTSVRTSGATDMELTQDVV